MALRRQPLRLARAVITKRGVGPANRRAPATAKTPAGTTDVLYRREMRSGHRKSAMRVKRGRVQKKNNWDADRRDYFAWSQEEIRLDRKDPGDGYRHVVTIPELRKFIGLLPEWDEIAVGLDAVVLDQGRDEAMGWYSEGVVSLSAWPAHSGFWWESTPEWTEEARELLSLLDVRIDHSDGRVGLLWTQAQARAFMLLDVLPHELGHHRDLITTRSRRVSRGEPFADAYARNLLDEIWPVYIQHFDI